MSSMRTKGNRPSIQKSGHATVDMFDNMWSYERRPVTVKCRHCGEDFTGKGIIPYVQHELSCPPPLIVPKQMSWAEIVNQLNNLLRDEH